MRQSTDTTTFRISDGTAERSRMVSGLPCTGTRNTVATIEASVSRVAMPLSNMKAKRTSFCSVAMAVFSAS